MQFTRTCLVAFLVGSVLALTGCGQPRYIDDSLETHVQSFERRYSVFFPGNVVLADLERPVVGLCHMNRDASWRLIEIDRVYASNANYLELEELVYHEMGHCAMMLPHTEERDENGCPVSIMYPYVFGSWWCYSSDPQKYYNELEEQWKTSSGRR